MLIIGFGVTEVLLSTLVFTCETCGNHAAHQLTKQNRKFSLSSFRCSRSVRNTSTAVPLVGESLRSARSRPRQRPGRSARTCGDSAKAFTSAQGRLTNGPGASSQVQSRCRRRLARLKHNPERELRGGPVPPTSRHLPRVFLIGPEIAKTGRPVMRVNQVCQWLWVDWVLRATPPQLVHASIADWVYSRQDDARDLGSAAAQVP